MHLCLFRSFLLLEMSSFSLAASFLSFKIQLKAHGFTGNSVINTKVGVRLTAAGAEAQAKSKQEKEAEQL